jgi:uncharacterized protein YjbI with pentapeptide repeats
LARLQQRVDVWNEWRRSQDEFFAADLSGADFSGADMTAASLVAANFAFANLRGANLSHAILDFANLSGSDLIEANLSGVELRNTILANLDLAQSSGLDTARHIGPSTIGTDTILLSKGAIPDIFLRGAGVPDEFINFAKSLVGSAIKLYSCFISDLSDRPFECIVVELKS